MNSPIQFYRANALLRVQLPAAMLLTLLQRTPAERLLNPAAQIVATPLGAVLRSALASAASLGAMHSLAGATTFIPSMAGPVTVNVGATLTVGFTVTDTINIGSWQIGGSFPPGLSMTATQGGAPLTAPGVLDATSGGMDDGYGGTSGGNTATTPLLTGSPTQPGTYTMTLQAFQSGAKGGLASKTYNYTIVVAGSAQPTPPTFSTQPSGQTAGVGASATFTAAASGSPTFEWRRNGTAVTGGTSAALTVSNVQPTTAGIYYARVTNSSGTATSTPAILGVNSTVKLVGNGTEFPDIVASNGNVYDQILLSDTAASVKADPGQILRISYIDLNDDIVQVEFSGAGTLTLVLDNPTGPATPLKYNQTVNYMKGHASILLTGADVTTNLSVFSVGTAVNGNPALYRSDVTYDGFADLAFIAISSTDGKFGGLRAANASFFATKGYTGIYAPGVQFTGPLFVSDVSASDDATPTLTIGSGTDIRITGGDLLQPNGRPVQVKGITTMRLTAGGSSHSGRPLLDPQTNKATFQEDGVAKQITTTP